MTAQQAKQKSKQVNDEKNRNHYVSIIEMINDACSNGNTEAVYYKQIPKEAKQVLINDGFELAEQWDSRNEYSLVIRW